MKSKIDRFTYVHPTTELRKPMKSVVTGPYLLLLACVVSRRQSRFQEALVPRHISVSPHP